MKNTVIIVPTYYGLDSQCREAIDICKGKGAHSLELKGCSNVTLARNLALSLALDAPSSVLLLIDDDIIFTPAQAEQLIKEAERTDRLVSGVYMLSETRAAYQQADNGYLCGLGFAAVTMSRLKALRDKLPKLRSRSGDVFYPFCQSRELNGKWYTEDMWFCYTLGGALLFPIGVGHNKGGGTLYPPKQLLEAIQ